MKPNTPTRVLFVCIGNACRSQMAEALARHHASDIIEATSAGISPLGSIPDATRQILLERGVDIGTQRSKGPSEVDIDATDLIVNMTGIPGKSLFQPPLEIEDWEIDDPYQEGMPVYRRVCDDVQEKVLELAKRLRASHASAKTA